MVDRGDRPSRHGELMGNLLARLAEAGNTGELEGILSFMCATCAFRRGSLPNTSAGTGMIVFNCAVGIDSDRFACHHGMKDGHPQKLCAGYLAAKNAPFEVMKAETAQLYDALSRLGDDDATRNAFDAWAEREDPNRMLDVYELARQWARHVAATAAVTEGS